MKSRLLLLLLASVTAAAVAATSAATWTNPIQNTDKTAIPATGAGSISGSRIEYGTCTGSGSTLAIGTKMGEVVQTVGTPSGTLPNLSPGTYCAQVHVTNTYGSESGPSLVVSKTIAAPTPQAPTNFSWP